MITEKNKNDSTVPAASAIANASTDMITFSKSKFLNASFRLMQEKTSRRIPVFLMPEMPDTKQEEKKPETLQTEKMEDKCYWILMNLQSTHS